MRAPTVSTGRRGRAWRSRARKFLLVVKMVVNCMIVGREKKCELVRLEAIDEVNNLRVSRAFLTVYLYFSSSGDF